MTPRVLLDGLRRSPRYSGALTALCEMLSVSLPLWQTLTFSVAASAGWAATAVSTAIRRMCFKFFAPLVSS